VKGTKEAEVDGEYFGVTLIVPRDACEIRHLTLHHMKNFALFSVLKQQVLESSIINHTG
jgi:hypothetical protein